MIPDDTTPNPNEDTITSQSNIQERVGYVFVIDVTADEKSFKDVFISYNSSSD